MRLVKWLIARVFFEYLEKLWGMETLRKRDLLGLRYEECFRFKHLVVKNKSYANNPKLRVSSHKRFVQLQSR